MVSSPPFVSPYRIGIQQEEFTWEPDMEAYCGISRVLERAASLDAGRRDGRGDVYRIGGRKEKARREHISLPSLYVLIAFWYSELVVYESVDENGYRYE